MGRVAFVFYNDKLYTVIKRYGSGMAEIREVNGRKVELVEQYKLSPLFNNDKVDQEDAE